ncbi:MAG: hypothetical protein CVU50_07835 [Candidatus Cloacimonetes bacterium HGW-Cloacimonetes-3]|jgi:signal transduction histidine kinase|nr:MAG: hypothetical protein CVU50_07835 [Candidatus Cloacimonetes bacterium HGW-Cloacimonetes-3]
MLRKAAILITFLCFLAIATATDAQQLLDELKLAQRDNKLISQTTILLKLGDYYLNSKDYLSAANYYQRAFELAKQRKHTGDIVFASAQAGNACDLQGDFAQALKWYSTALSHATNTTEEKRLSYIHNNIGNLYLKIGSFAKSLEHYQKALEIKKGQKDKPGIANALMNMSVFYLQTGNLAKTLEYQQQALVLRKEIGDQYQIATTLSSISVTFRHLNNYPKAFDYNHQALAIYTRLNNPAKIASAYNNLGVLYLYSGDLNRARENYLKSYQLKQDSRDWQSILSTLNNLADIALKQNKLPEAFLYISKANSIQQNSQFYDISRTLYKINSEYYEAIGNHRAALKYFKQYYTLSDSLANEQKSKQISELEIKYEVLEKEKNIELLTKNNELSQRDLKKSSQLRNYLVVIICLILIIVIILISRYRSTLRLNKKINASRDKLNDLNRELEMRVETEVARRQEQEQRALRQSRLAILGELAAGIAHELNQPMQTLSLTLENIMLAIHDKQVNGDYLEQKVNYLFADISRMQDVIEHIRCFSRQSDETSHIKFSLKQSIQNAIAMVQDRFIAKGVQIVSNLADGIPEVSGNPYKFEHVILNLLTNARDAIGEKMDASLQSEGIIEVSTYMQDSKLLVKVTDNGCGIPEELQDKVFDIFFTTKSLEKGTGLGLSISAGIVKGMNATLAIASDPGSGTTVTISIPLI